MRGLISSTTIAADMDILRTETVNGDVRRFATGIEVWMARARTAVRSGLSFDTLGEKNVTGSAGISVAGPFGMFFDAAMLYGADTARNGLSLGASLTF